MSKSFQNPFPHDAEECRGRIEPLTVLSSQIEALLFLADSPVSEGELRSLLEVSGSEISKALCALSDHLIRAGHGLVLKSLAGGWVLETNPHFAEVLVRFRDTAQRCRVRLSRAAVETLAIIAYNQPVTRSEVEELRGVRSERVIDTLLTHELIRIAGRKKASGSPLLYRTTPRFLDLFGLEAVADLPSLEELGELGGGPLGECDQPGEGKSDEAVSQASGADGPDEEGDENAP